MMAPYAIHITGASGSGVTTLGRALAAATGAVQLDTEFELCSGGLIAHGAESVEGIWIHVEGQIEFVFRDAAQQAVD